MRDFLDWLWDGFDDHYGEMRLIIDGAVSQSWWPIPKYTCHLADAAIDRDREGADVYVGVLPRIRTGGKTDDVTPYTRTVWVDVDGKHFDGGKRDALDALLNFPVSPQVIVDSGHGYHAYFRLDHLYLFDDVQPIMRGIAKRIGGDAVHDRARILRLPGLSNHKEGGNAPVRLLRFDTTSSFLLGDLAEFQYREPKVSLGELWVRESVRAWEREGWLSDAALELDPGKGARSEHDFAVVCKMLEHGWSRGEIVKAFLDHPQGVGAKTAKQGLRYLERTIDAAYRAVGA